jgi:hypothetical protein
VLLTFKERASSAGGWRRGNKPRAKTCAAFHDTKTGKTRCFSGKYSSPYTNFFIATIVLNLIMHVVPDAEP